MSATVPSFARFLTESTLSAGTLVGGIKSLEKSLADHLGHMARFGGPAGYQKVTFSTGQAISITYFLTNHDIVIELVYGYHKLFKRASIVGIRVWHGSWINPHSGEPRDPDFTIDPDIWDLLDAQAIPVIASSIAHLVTQNRPGSAAVVIHEGYLAENAMQNTTDFRMLYDLYCQDKEIDDADIVDFSDFKAVCNSHGFNCPAIFNPLKNPAAKVSRAKVSLVKALESATVQANAGNGTLGAVVDSGYKSLVSMWRSAGMSAEQIVADLDDDLRGLVKVVATGNANSLVVAGRGGVGKTYSIEDELGHGEQGKTWWSLAGKTTVYSLYETFFLHRKKGGVVVLDDINVFGDQDAANLLKAALDSKPKRVITWSSKATEPMPRDFAGTMSEWLDEKEEAYWEALEAGSLAKFKLPNQVLFEAAVIFITNKPMGELYDNPHLGAVASRSLKLDYDLNDSEVLTKIKMMSAHIRKDVPAELKAEVLDVLAENVKSGLLTDLSMRQFVNGIGIAASGLPRDKWKRLLGYA